MDITLINTYEREKMKEILILLAVVGVWIILQTYILPKLGIAT